MGDPPIRATHRQINPPNKDLSLRTYREADRGNHLRPKRHGQLGGYSQAGTHWRPLIHSGHVASSTFMDLNCAPTPAAIPWSLCLLPVLNTCFFSCWVLNLKWPLQSHQVTTWEEWVSPSCVALVHSLVNWAPRLQGLWLPSLLLGISTSDKSFPLNSKSFKSSYLLIHHQANCPSLIFLQIRQD